MLSNSSPSIRRTHLQQLDRDHLGHRERRAPGRHRPGRPVLSPHPQAQPGLGPSQGAHPAPLPHLQPGEPEDRREHREGAVREGVPGDPVRAVGGSEDFRGAA